MRVIYHIIRGDEMSALLHGKLFVVSLGWELGHEELINRLQLCSDFRCHL